MLNKYPHMHLILLDLEGFESLKAGITRTP